MVSFFILVLMSHSNEERVDGASDLGSPPPKEKIPSARQTICPQGATRRYGTAGQFPPAEDGAVRRAVHRN